MNENREQVKLEENERLLTDQEKNYILGKIENRNHGKVVILCVAIFLIITAISACVFFFEGIKEGVICFLLCGIWVFPMLWNSWRTTNKLAKKIENKEVYVKEAIYRDSNKYHYATFEVNKHGKNELFFSNAYFPEKIMSGEKVILIRIDEVVVWVYKAMG